MAKYTGNYTNTVKKALASADRLACQVVGEGATKNIYICNGYFIFKMNVLEYSNLVQPVTHCEAGNWEIRNGNREALSINIPEFLQREINNAEQKPAAELTRCPVLFSVGKGEATALYNSRDNYTVILNNSFLGAIWAGAICTTVSPLSPVLFRDEMGVFAMVMPIKPEAKISRAVAAYFTDGETQPETNTALIEELNAAEKALAEAETEAAALRAQLEELKAQKSAELTAVPEQAPAARDDLQSIVERFTAIPGIVATVKGAQTASPVVWLSGDTQQNAATIKAAGGKWSTKRNMFYFRVA